MARRRASPQAILDRLQALGYPAYPFAAERRDSAEAATERALIFRLVVAAAGTAVLMAAPAVRAISPLAMTAIAVPTVVFAGWPFFESAWRALKTGAVNMDAPIALGVALTTLGSVFASGLHTRAYFDSAPMLLTFLLAGRTLDQRMRRKTREVAASLARLKPERAIKLDERGEARETAIAVDPARRSRAGARRRAHSPSTATVEDGRSESTRAWSPASPDPSPLRQARKSSLAR